MKIKTEIICPKCEEKGLVNYLFKQFWGGKDFYFICERCGYGEIKKEEQ